ncbi:MULTISPECIES: RICIN domain-containing protein [unclassified Streptomyces]|uniref:RICIN domain-containing protein n=1 Tax=unclassified Streptomyces TaxID=2593676 RepID=UPI00119F7124|nr:RICIN domain-containing protein [Streptomyces sp. BK340]TVZ99516.1 ricin-type beta-trefoil lectin protein [Streptomyces sp. BK340]
MANDQLISAGTFTILGPGGHLTHMGKGEDIVVLPPDGNAQQLWEVKPESGTYTLRNVATGYYLGSEGDPNQPTMMIRGSKQPYPWRTAQGPDGDPDTYLLAPGASNDGLVLTYSLLRIFPPRVAILPSSEYRDPEWCFRAV